MPGDCSFNRSLAKNPAWWMQYGSNALCGMFAMRCTKPLHNPREEIRFAYEQYSVGIALLNMQRNLCSLLGIFNETYCRLHVAVRISGDQPNGQAQPFEKPFVHVHVNL